MSLETALPTGADGAEAGEQATPTAAAADTSTETSSQEQHSEEASTLGAEEGGEQNPEAGEKPAKKEKTPEQREIERLRRRVDNITRQKYELAARLGQPQGRQNQDNPDSEDEPVTLSRAELNKIIAERAKELAPVVKDQQAEIERREGVIQSLTKEWGQEEFNAKAEDLDAVFGGLADRSGKPKPATEAIFYADDPKGVIEYFTDPENAAEAQRISRLPAVLAGREVARIEDKLKALKAQEKPQPSKAPKPVEPVRGGGTPKGMPDPRDTKAYIKWANEQERAGR